LVAACCCCAGFPHGVFPVSELLCISLLLRIWPRLRIYSIAATSTFQVPVWRHILSWTGARPATKHHFRCAAVHDSAMQSSTGQAVQGTAVQMHRWLSRVSVMSSGSIDKHDLQAVVV
jgi:hypothetical protein